MPSYSAVVASNAEYAPSYVPTAVFIGGTQGIGRAMAETFAKQTKGRANIILVARTKATADQILSNLPTSSENVQRLFIPCDASELKDVARACEQLKSQVTKINYLVLTIDNLGDRTRQETSEGNDRIMVLRYYARAKFIMELLPLLSNARNDGEEARVLTICGAALGYKANLEDPGVTRNWSLLKAMFTTRTYNDIMVKTLGSQYPDISFTHATPGLVDTPGSRSWWLSSILITLLKPTGLAFTPEVCAQYMLYPLWNSQFSKGTHYVNFHANNLTLSSNVTEEVTTKIWEHTQEVIRTKE